MADHFSAFLDFRPLTPTSNSNSNSNLLFLPSNRCYASAFLHSHTSRLNAFKRKPLSKPSSSSSPPPPSNFDVISIHEQSDGSLLFKFGDPSDIAKNLKTKKSKDGIRGVKVAEKRRKAVKKGSDLIEADQGAETNSAPMITQTIDSVKQKDGFDEKLSEGLNDVEVPFSVAIEEKNAASSGVHVEEDIRNLEKVVGQKQEDLSSADASVPEDMVPTEDFLEKETDGLATLVFTTEESADSEHKNVDTKIQNEIIKNGEGIVKSDTMSTPPLSELAMNPHRVIEDQNFQLGVDSGSNMNDLTVPEAQDVIEDRNLQLGEGSGSDMNELIVAEAQDVIEDPNLQPGESSDSDKNDVIVPEAKDAVGDQNVQLGEGSESDTNDLVVPEAQDVFEDPNLQLGDSGWDMNDLIVPEAQDVIEDQNLKLRDESGCDMNDLMVPKAQDVIEDHNLQLEEGNGSGTNDLIVPEAQDVIPYNEDRLDINGTDTSQASNPIVFEGQASEIGTGFPDNIVNQDESSRVPLPAVSAQMEAEPLLKEIGTVTMESLAEDNGAEMLTSNLILGPARTEGDNNVQNGNLIEASPDEQTVVKFIESARTSKNTCVSDLALSSGAALFPHPSKVLTGGEDAYFIAGQTWLGVADGVGCWSLEGTVPGVFAKELTRTCARLYDCEGDTVNSVAEFLNLCIAETHAPGSSTILIAHFDGQALHVANVGDSGFIILRHDTVYQKSSPMYHAFHFPVQVEQGSDEPSCHLAEFYKVDLEESDVIVTATDGLFDNLYDQEISSIVTESIAAGKNLEEIAEVLAKKAQAIGGYPFGRSPFADSAQAAGYSGFTGGKLDDVAVILSVVRRQSEN